MGSGKDYGTGEAVRVAHTDEPLAGANYSFLR